MWHNLKLEKLSGVDKIVAEFTVWMEEILPSGKMKIKIYESQDGTYIGTTDLCIKRKFDGYPAGAIGTGKTTDATLVDTINYFKEMLKEDGLDMLTEEDIEYTAYSDF